MQGQDAGPSPAEAHGVETTPGFRETKIIQCRITMFYEGFLFDKGPLLFFINLHCESYPPWNEPAGPRKLTAGRRSFSRMDDFHMSSNQLTLLICSYLCFFSGDEIRPSSKRDSLRKRKTDISRLFSDLEFPKLIIPMLLSFFFGNKEGVVTCS